MSTSIQNSTECVLNIIFAHVNASHPRKLVTISVECAFNCRTPNAMYCFCWLSGLTGVARAYISSYGSRVLINPRSMREGYGSRSVCVCYHANCYIPCFFIKIQVSLGFLCCFQWMHCVDFTENALFKSSGNIYWLPLPSLLLGQFLVDKRDSNGFFSK